MSGVDGAGRAPQANPGAVAERPAQGPAPQNRGPTAAQTGAAGAPAAGMPVTDGMGEAMLTQTPQLTPTDAGLRAGQAGNPFEQLGQLMKNAAPAMDAAELRLSEVLVGLDQDLVPADESLAKLAGFGKRAVEKEGRFAKHQTTMQRTTAKLQDGTMLLMADAVDGDGVDADSPLSGVRNHIAGVVVTNPKSPNLGAQVGNAVFQNKSSFPLGMDVNAFVQAVLREAYMLDGELLMDEARKLDALNKWKKRALEKKRRVQALRLQLKEDLSDSERHEVMEELGQLLDFEPDGTPPPVQADDAPGGDSDASGNGGAEVDGPEGTGGSSGASENVDSGNEAEAKGLNAEAIGFLDDIARVNFGSPANVRSELLSFIASGSAWATSDAIVEWFMERVPHEHVAGVHNEEATDLFKELMLGAAQLSPAEYATLAKGLMLAIVRAQGADGKYEKGVDNGYDDNFHDRCDHRGGDCHWAFRPALKRLLASGTPSQLAAIGQMDRKTVQMLDQIGGTRMGGRALALKDIIDSAPGTVANNPFPATTDEFKLWELFENAAATGFERGVDLLFYELSGVEPQTAGNFLEEVSKHLPATGGDLSLAELFGALPPGHLEGENLKHFSFLNEVDFETPESVSTTSTAAERLREAMGTEQRSERLMEEDVGWKNNRVLGGKLELDDDSAAMNESDSAPPPKDVTNTDSAMTAPTGGSEEDPFEASLEIDFNDGGEPPVIHYNQMDAKTLDEELENRIGMIDDAIETRGFDMSELQLKIQNIQQRRQQMLTMMSNISKMLHETIMSIIRNIGG